MDILEDDEEESSFGTGSWREGRDLIDRELGGNSTARRRDDVFGPSASRAAPILSIPAARAAAGSSSSPIRASTHASASTGRPGQSARQAAREIEAEGEDDNFFQILGHRMKNTIDTFESPKWFQELGDGIKKPKWMGGDDEGSRAGGSGNQGDIRRWFGSGSNDGRIRL
jgi:hypothetical protein